MSAATLSQNILYAVSGVLTGMLVAYMFLDDGSDNSENSPIVVSSNSAQQPDDARLKYLQSDEENIAKKVLPSKKKGENQREELTAASDAEKNASASGKPSEKKKNDDAKKAVENENNTTKNNQQAESMPKEKKSTMTAKEKIEKDTVAKDNAGKGSKKPHAEKNFDRYHGWSKWGPSYGPYNVKYGVETLEKCEELCYADASCAGSTFIGKTCGLFNHGELSGEVNLDAVTSVKIDGGTGKVCHGPVPMVPGKPNERPANAPCHPSSEVAVNHTLEKARPLSIFAPLFHSSRRDAFHL